MGVMKGILYMKRLTFLLAALLLSLLASSAFAQSFNNTTNVTGTGWSWDHSTLTLTLSESASLDSIVLPDKSTIVIPVGKTLTVTNSITPDAAAITCDGDLTIQGGGTLTVRAANASGLSTKTLTAANIAFDVDASAGTNGILASGGDASVTLKNCTGSIQGGSRGIDVDGAKVDVSISECHNLAVTGRSGNSTSGNFPQSGIRVMSTVAGEYQANLTIEDCNNVTITGGTAIAMDAKANSLTPVSFAIKNSSAVQINGSNTIYAAVFINNVKNSNDNTNKNGSVTIENSNVTINIPGGTGIMTSVHDKNTQTNVNITDSQVRFIANLGVKASNKGTGGTAGIDTDNSIIRMELSGEKPFVVATQDEDGNKVGDGHPMPDEDKKGLLVLIKQEAATVTLYDDFTMAQDYQFPADAKFVNAGDYALNVKPGVTLNIAGKAYYFPDGGQLIINPDGTVQVILAGAAAAEADSSANMPQTGDNSQMALWLYMMAASAAILAVSARRKAER